MEGIVTRARFSAWRAFARLLATSASFAAVNRDRSHSVAKSENVRWCASRSTSRPSTGDMVKGNLVRAGAVVVWALRQGVGVAEMCSRSVVECHRRQCVGLAAGLTAAQERRVAIPIGFLDAQKGVVAPAVHPWELGAASTHDQRDRGHDGLPASMARVDGMVKVHAAGDNKSSFRASNRSGDRNRSPTLRATRASSSGLLRSSSLGHQACNGVMTDSRLISGAVRTGGCASPRRCERASCAVSQRRGIWRRPAGARAPEPVRALESPLPASPGRKACPARHARRIASCRGPGGCRHFHRGGRCVSARAAARVSCLERAGDHASVHARISALLDE